MRYFKDSHNDIWTWNNDLTDCLQIYYKEENIWQTGAGGFPINKFESWELKEITEEEAFLEIL